MKRILLSAGALSATGIFLLSLFPSTVTYAVTVITFCLAVLFACLYNKYRSAFSVSFCLLLSFAVFLSYCFTVTEEEHQKSTLIGRTAKITATVIEEPSKGVDSTAYYVETDSVGINGAPQKIRLMLHSSDRQIKEFDRISATVTFEEPDGKYRSSLYPEKVYVDTRTESIKYIGESEGFHPYKYMISLRKAVRDSITSNLPDNTEGILAGFIIGGNDLLDDETYGAFKACGISHMIAVSGMHMAVLCSVITKIFESFGIGGRVKVFAIAPLLVLYSALSGFSPSSVRAVIMVCASMTSSIFRKRTDRLNLLGGAAVLMLAVQPNLLFSLSFELSFVSLLGILVLSPAVCAVTTDRLKVRGVLGIILKYICDSAVTSLCASIGTYPIIVIVFGAVSNVSILANIAISFATTTAIIFGMFCVLFDLVFGGLIASALYSVCDLLLNYIRGTAILISRLPFSYEKYDSLASVLIAAAAAGFMIYVYSAGRRVTLKKLSVGFGIAAMCVAAVHISSRYLPLPW